MAEQIRAGRPQTRPAARIAAQPAPAGRPALPESRAMTLSPLAEAVRLALPGPAAVAESRFLARLAAARPWPRPAGRTRGRAGPRARRSGRPPAECQPAAAGLLGPGPRPPAGGREPRGRAGSARYSGAGSWPR